MTVSSQTAYAIAVALGMLFSALLAAPTATAAPTDTAITWAVTPASDSGPDGRSWVEEELDPGTPSTSPSVTSATSTPPSPSPPPTAT